MESQRSEAGHPVSFYEFYIRGPNVFNVGYRPFIADLLYNMELPGRPVNDVEDETTRIQQVYVGVYGCEKKVKTLHERLEKQRPVNAKVSEITPPVKTSSPKHKIPEDLNAMHLYMTYLNLHQTTKGVDHLINIEETLTDMNSSLNDINKSLTDLPKNIANAITKR